MSESFARNLLDTHEALTLLLEETRTIAVLGIKPESVADQPAHYVPAYAASRGFEIAPVPVYYPDVTSILGRPVYRSVVEATRAIGPIDIVDVFRRPEALNPHLDDLLRANPKCVWLQSGIRDDAFAERLAKAGIRVVQDRCLLVELQRRPELRPAGPSAARSRLTE